MKIKKDDLTIKAFIYAERKLIRKRIQLYDEMLNLNGAQSITNKLLKLKNIEVDRLVQIENLVTNHIDSPEAIADFLLTKDELKIDTGCKVKQAPYGIYIDDIKQEGVKDVQIKKNSRQWTEVQITYMANTFIKEKSLNEV
ncbi:MAG: hypothetical protein K2O75_03565 [Lactobacillus sp.]|uniref:hypothetical protein n=1 Tax=Lactobacillus sp. TaxID=1591 RepID=UPI0023CBA811|nr:hypothetical protein [Lactobacillus sp.]MDE7049927.1 hypothetical protein [Lactobacillus sp.]